MNYAHQPTTQQVEGGEQMELRKKQNNRRGKGGYIWPSSNKQFPKPYERGVNEVKMHNTSTVSYTHLDVYKRQIMR